MTEAKFNKLMAAFESCLNTQNVDPYFNIAAFSAKIAEDQPKVDVILPVGSNWATGQSSVSVANTELVDVKVAGQSGHKIAFNNQGILTTAFRTWSASDAAKAIFTEVEA